MQPHIISDLLQHVVTQFQDERVRIEGAISKLEHFVTHLLDSASEQNNSQTNQRVLMGRTRSRAGWTPEARAAASARMQAYWAGTRNGGDTMLRRSKRKKNLMSIPKNFSETESSQIKQRRNVAA